MADKKAQDPVKTTSSESISMTTTYVTEQAPSLPTADVETTRDDAVIDTRLIELRNVEAQKNADAVSK